MFGQRAEGSESGSLARSMSARFSADRHPPLSLPPRPPRLPIVCTVEVADSVTSSRNQVLNISTRGFRIKSSAFKVGEKLFVEITGMPRKKAVVRWTGEGETGFEFLMPLSYGELESWTVRRQTDTEAA